LEVAAGHFVQVEATVPPVQLDDVVYHVRYRGGKKTPETVYTSAGFELQITLLDAKERRYRIDVTSCYLLPPMYVVRLLARKLAGRTNVEVGWPAHLEAEGASALEAVRPSRIVAERHKSEVGALQSAGTTLVPVPPFGPYPTADALLADYVLWGPLAARYQGDRHLMPNHMEALGRLLAQQTKCHAYVSALREELVEEALARQDNAKDALKAAREAAAPNLLANMTPETKKEKLALVAKEQQRLVDATAQVEKRRETVQLAKKDRGFRFHYHAIRGHWSVSLVIGGIKRWFHCDPRHRHRHRSGDAEDKDDEHKGPLRREHIKKATCSTFVGIKASDGRKLTVPGDLDAWQCGYVCVAVAYDWIVEGCTASQFATRVYNPDELQRVATSWLLTGQCTSFPSKQSK
jgi:hypothetical protein